MKKIKKSKVALIILLVIITVFLVAYLSFRAAYNQNIHTDFKTVNSTGKEVENTDRINILVLGMEDTRTDMMMVATFDPKNKKLDMFSIPRDTYIENDYDPGFKKINSVYEYPTTKGGVERVAGEVSKILDMPIHDYVMVEYDAVAKLADAVGGVDIEIPFNMYYDDPYSKPFPLHIHFQKGLNHIDGSNAIQYLRWRHNNDNSHSAEGDEGRVHRQQDFMKKVLEKALSANNLPKVAEAVLKSVKTSLEFEQAMGLAKSASSMKPEDIHFYQEIGLPAYFNRLWYYVADKEQTQKLVHKVLNSETITDEDLNPTKEFEQYIYTIDKSPFNPTRRGLGYDNTTNSYYSKSNSSTQDMPVSPRKKKRHSVSDTKIQETDENKNSDLSPIFHENNKKDEQDKVKEEKHENKTNEKNTQNKENTETNEPVENKVNKPQENQTQEQPQTPTVPQVKHEDTPQVQNENKPEPTKTPEVQVQAPQETTAPEPSPIF